MDVKQENTMSDEWTTIEPNQAEPEEKIEIEIEGQEEQQSLPLEVEQEEPVKEQVKEKQEEEKTDEEQALEGVETSGAQKRIRQLVSQKKEREAEIEKLLEQNKQMQVALQQREDEYRNALSSNLENSEKQIQERLAVARDSYKRAVDSGDSDLILKAQEYLNSAQLDASRLGDAKKQFEQTAPVEQQQEAEAQQSQQESYMGYDMKAYQWASQNEWFNRDQILTSAALVIDQQLKEEGFDPKEDEFYTEVNKRLADAFPHKFGGNTETPVPQETSSPAQVVAGASLAPKASSGKKVKLTQEDVRLAQKWGISLEQYAQEKLKIEQAGDGAYTTI
jgi:hypothetical protein|tara:strand:- start:3547 stop:4551 length:1005 start_codon:yes stop_codon:yes gene_type:complete